MAKPDSELIRQIADQVIAHLQRQGGERAPSAKASAQEIHPPVGVCTGDYGQFTDRPDLVGRPERNPTPSEEPDAAPAPAAPVLPPPLSGIITASQLEEAVARDGQVRLAINARLTPLAADYVRENPKVVQRVTAANASSTSAAGRGRTLLWIDGHCPTVHKLLAARGAGLQASAAAKSEAGLLQAIRDISAGVSAGTLKGGLLFVRSAALANVAANRVHNLRAITATCPEAVRAGVESVAANVLIVEYLYTSAERITAMAEAMLAAEPRPRPMLQRELAALARPV